MYSCYVYTLLDYEASYLPQLIAHQMLLGYVLKINVSVTHMQ